MSYLDDAGEWERFWHEHRAAVIGDREPLTFEGHGLGLLAHKRDLLGSPNVYPYYQRLTGSAWIRQILETTASGITNRGLNLRCQPGRMLLDGCGLTVARVEYRKQQRDGTWLIGLAMNRTQCRSSSDDHLVDPLLLRSATATSPPPSAALEGYLVGAYCIERELLSWRRLRFPLGVQIGDLVVFPNTAGYLMHILESASHQIPLARNVLIQGTGRIELDPIDDFPNAPSLGGRGAGSS